MKILASFDTTLRDNLYLTSIEKYWKEKVLLVRRVHWFFIFQVLLPLIAFGLLVFMTIIFVRRAIDYMALGVWSKTVIDIIIIFILILIFWLKIIKKFIDYKMDFTLVTPDEITCCNQTWFFSRSVRTLESVTIKSVTIPKTDFWESLFNYWVLVFLAETEIDSQEEEEWKWYVRFFWVHDVESARRKILEIIESKWFISRE